jgi:aspartyl-tRNA(Asn)/glutamyl-tRNA(Gln) amidotransferase subunit C
MELTAEAIQKLALLSRLHIADEEIPVLKGKLEHIIDHMAELSALDLSDVPPMMHPDSGERPLREDVPQPSLPRDIALANAPKSVEGFFAIPKVIGAA